MEQRIEIGDGKYTLIVESKPNKFVFKALRYGEEWKDLIGDNLVLAMFHEIEDLRESINCIKKSLDSIKNPQNIKGDKLIEIIKERIELLESKKC